MGTHRYLPNAVGCKFYPNILGATGQHGSGALAMFISFEGAIPFLGNDCEKIMGIIFGMLIL